MSIARLSRYDVRWCSMIPAGICTPDWLTASSTNRTWPSSSSSSSCSYGIAGMVTLNVFSAKAA
ncbi:Uncharacterised protein [Mycobacterium tuberculosis]|nr:Uncharacterised protein [Mycobacterium tuberculosis]CKU19917.1 Uncharacterised protein [Mycobacterium tuberculosis]